MSETFDERLDYLAESIDRLEDQVVVLRDRCNQQNELLTVLFLAVRPPEMQDTIKGEAKWMRVLGHGDSVLRWHIHTYAIYPVFGDEKEGPE